MGKQHLDLLSKFAGDFVVTGFCDVACHLAVKNGNVSISDQQEDLAPEDSFPGANDADAFTDIDTTDEATASGDQARGQGSDAIDVVDGTKLRGPAESALDILKTPFTTPNNTVSASTTPNADEGAAAEDLATARQELLNGTADDVFGPAAVNELFLGPCPDGIAATDGGRIGDVTPREPPDGETALSLLANGYSASADETIPAKSAQLVDGDDVATAAHDGVRNCLFVGSICTAYSFGACISRDCVLCCFNSPFGRLAKESAMPQFGRDLGSADAPDCRGLASAEIQRFDWAALDLDQWITILGTAERYPDPNKLTPDGLTSTGNYLDLVDPDEPRLVITRTRQRLDGIDTDQVHRHGRDQLRAGE